mmetsp:Transcript_39933/g.99927  ORF Transcript_39933/g.99927 Transcript_39933/m.99927 type:complete len:330 (-) Transcript_39933:203-1192(-)
MYPSTHSINHGHPSSCWSFDALHLDAPTVLLFALHPLDDPLVGLLLLHLAQPLDHSLVRVTGLLLGDCLDAVELVKHLLAGGRGTTPNAARHGQVLARSLHEHLECCASAQLLDVVHTVVKLGCRGHRSHLLRHLLLLDEHVHRCIGRVGVAVEDLQPSVILALLVPEAAHVAEWVLSVVRDGLRLLLSVSGPLFQLSLSLVEHLNGGQARWVNLVLPICQYRQDEVPPRFEQDCHNIEDRGHCAGVIVVGILLQLFKAVLVSAIAVTDFSPVHTHQVPTQRVISAKALCEVQSSSSHLLLCCGHRLCVCGILRSVDIEVAKCKVPTTR